MSTSNRLHLWQWLHKWSSLICTTFLLLICLTGLPLIFGEEVGHWLDEDPPYVVLPGDTPAASLDGMVAESQRRYPGHIVTYVFVDDDEPKVVVGMAPSWSSFQDEPKNNHFLKFDARTAQLLKESDPPDQRRYTFMQIMLKLHANLFMDLPGALFLGFMGLLFVVAVVSGVALYGPYMKKLDFGTVRASRSNRLRWLDLHNLLGIVTLAWGLVVGLTGVVNELSTPLFTLWGRTDVQAMVKPWQGQTVPRQGEWTSIQAAFETATKAVPGMRVMSVAYPGSRLGSPHHYLIWAKGETPLTSRLFSPVLVDARTGELTAVLQMPWYLRALEVSRPLHFGDYGGMPLKILWAVLDLITILVLGSGLYLWVARCKSKRARVEQFTQTRIENPPFQSEKRLPL